MDAEDARSDLLLSGAVFLIGGAILGLLLDLLLNFLPFGRIPFLLPVLAIALPLAITVLVPYLLMRYRGEPWATYGLSSQAVGLLGAGALVGVPVVVASALATASQGSGVVQALPLIPGGGGDVLALLRRLAQFGGLALLGVYVTVKARDAFGSMPRKTHAVVYEVLRVVAIIAVIAGGLLVVRALVAGNVIVALTLLLRALGVAGAVWLAVREVPEAAATSRPVLVVPTVIFGLAGFAFSFDVAGFLGLVYNAALLAAIGLVVGLLQETRRSGFAALGLALLIAALSSFGQVVGPSQVIGALSA